MSAKKPVLKLFLDEGVPDSVGQIFLNAGHNVFFLRESLAPGSPDQLVCTISEVNDAILVAIDGDMKKLAQRRGVGQRRYRTLSLIKLSCRETKAAGRVESAMSLIEHEWNYSSETTDRRIFIEIKNDVIRTHR